MVQIFIYETKSLEWVSAAKAADLQARGHASIQNYKVQLLAGTKHGQPGEIVVMPHSKALAEIAAGRAVAVKQ